MTHSRLAGITVVVLIATIAPLISMRVQYVQRAQAVRRGCLTDQQIADEAQKVFERLDPGTSRLDMSVRPTRLQSSNGATQLRYVVDCSDTAGQPVGYGIWDGETGIPCAVFPSRKSNTVRIVPAIPVGEALDAARSWLSALDVDSRNVRWRSAHAPGHTRNCWVTYWRTPGWSAVVMTDRQTGNLVSIHSWLSSSWKPIGNLAARPLDSRTIATTPSNTPTTPVLRYARGAAVAL